jgi:hypothetical protein
MRLSSWCVSHDVTQIAPGGPRCGTLAAVGCDPAAIDPLRILAGIASDETKPPTARVAACKVLIAARSGPADPADDLAVVTNGALGDRAIRLLAASRRGH